MFPSNLKLESLLQGNWPEIEFTSGNCYYCFTEVISVSFSDVSKSKETMLTLCLHSCARQLEFHCPIHTVVPQAHGRRVPRHDDGLLPGRVVHDGARAGTRRHASRGQLAPRERVA